VYRCQKPTSKVDIFSLGCCIFYLLTSGRRPHEDAGSPSNKYMLSANVQHGKYNMRPLMTVMADAPSSRQQQQPARTHHMPGLAEAAHFIEAAIASKPADRPSARWLVHWHPHLWPDQKRFAFLCAVANDRGEVMKGNDSGVGVGDEKKRFSSVLPASLVLSVVGKGTTSRSSSNNYNRSGEGRGGGWVNLVDTAVWEQYTSDTRYRQVYDTSKLTHLLRFIRNASQHPPPARSAAKAAFAAEGGVGPYFLSRFPRLLVVVWEAVGAASWGCRQEFSTFLPPPENAGFGSSRSTSTSSSGEGCDSGSVQRIRGRARVAEEVPMQVPLTEQQKEKEAAAEPVSASTTAVAPAAAAAAAAAAAVGAAPPTTASVSSIDASSGAGARNDTDARSWTERQVVAWLAGIGTASAFVKYGDAFETSGVNGELLLDGIEEEDLMDLGVASRLHRKRIMQDIAKLRIKGRPS
jgi:hypothetical protein